MIKFYKSAMVMFLCSLFGLMTTQAQMPQFKMTTTKSVGQSFKFTLNYGPTVRVDWGDGVSVEYLSTSKPIEGELKGTTVSVSGHDISMINCYDQEITDLSVEQITTLSSLLCSKNKLTTLNLSQNTNLVKLNCSHNELTTISLRELAKLQELNFSFNNVASATILSSNKSLQILICNNNELPSLSVSMNPELRTLWCYSNKIKTLAVSRNTKLESLLCYKNEIEVMNVTGLTALKSFWCDNNNLKSVNLSTNTALSYLSIDHNSLTSLSLPSTSNLKSFYVNNNALGFGGLHSGSGITNYNYNGQYLIILPETSYIEINQELDLSDQLQSQDGTATQAVFNWFGDGQNLTAGTDYSENNGKFTFLKSFDKAYCEITSSLFPDIAKITTNTIGVGSTLDVEINPEEAFKVFAHDGRLIVKIPTEQPLKIHNVMGKLIKSIESVVGTVEIELPKGTYIVNNKKIIL